MQEALGNLWSFLTVFGFGQSIKKAIEVMRREGWRGLWIRLARRSFKLRHPAILPGVALEPSMGVKVKLPATIVHLGNDQYALRDGAGTYSYIPPRRPVNLKDDIQAKDRPPCFSVIVPLYNTSLDLLERVIASVKNQWYKNWELILVDDASPDEEIRKFLEEVTHPQVRKYRLKQNKGISGATNVGFENAVGDFIVLLDHDDELTEDCLYELALCIDRECPDYIYSDEDKIDSKGQYVQPHFKPDWSPDAMMSTMLTCHVLCFRRSLLKKVGNLNSHYDGCQDWDFVLRISEHTNKIAHIPKVLYHWRIIPQSVAADLTAKPHAIDLSKRVRAEALKRRGALGKLEPVERVPGYFSVKYLLKGDPLISIVIPSRDNHAVLKQCIDSILSTTSYQHFEITIIDNGSVDPSTLKYLDGVSGNSKIEVLRYDKPFNFSELNNVGAHESRGDILLFLNDDTEIRQEDWLERLAAYAQQPHIGAVGAKLLYPNSNRNQHAGILNLEDGPGHAFLGEDGDAPGYFMRNLLEYNWLAVTGACLMIERVKFEKIGGFDQSLPVAYNDVEIGIRLHKAGFFNVVCQRVRLTHHESVSRGLDHLDAEKAARLKRERKHLYRLHPEYFQYDPFFNINLHPNGIHFEVAH